MSITLGGKVIHARHSSYLTEKVCLRYEKLDLEAFSLHIVVHTIDGRQVVNPDPRHPYNANALFAEIYVVASHVRWGKISGVLAPTYMELATPIYRNRQGVESGPIALSFAPQRSFFTIKAKGIRVKTSPNLDEDAQVRFYDGKGELLHNVVRPLFTEAYLPEEREAVQPAAPIAMYRKRFKAAGK